MVNIQIDISSLLDQVYLDKSETDNLLDYTVKEITVRFADEWKQEAAKNLKSSRQEYISNINVVDEGFAKGAVVLTGWLPNGIESGIDQFDMKEGLLNGPNAKTSKSGTKYNTVPFSHGTPGSLEENFNGGVMPEEIHDIVKKAPVNNSGNSKQLVKDDLPKPFQMPMTKSLKDKGIDKNRTTTHQNAIYEGLRKHVDQTTGGTSYQTFRRVSENSSQNSWEYPGIEAKDLAGKAMQDFNIEAQLGSIFDQWWNDNK